MKLLRYVSHERFYSVTKKSTLVRKPQIFRLTRLFVFEWFISIQRTLAITSVFVTKDFAVKSNLLL